MSCPYVPPPWAVPRQAQLSRAISLHAIWHMQHPTQPCQYAEPEPAPRQPGRSPAALALIAAIRAYQLFVPRFLKGRCPMEPHCSQYGLEAVREHGAARGLAMICKRIWSCR